jgi:hypothetical protein
MAPIIIDQIRNQQQNNDQLKLLKLFGKPLIILNGTNEIDYIVYNNGIVYFCKFNDLQLTKFYP